MKKLYVFLSILLSSLVLGLGQTLAEETAENSWATTDDGKRCQADQQNLKYFQNKVFQLEGSGNQKLVDLLKKRDEVNAELAVHQTLLQIWNEYQKFLQGNSQIAQNGAIRNPEGTVELFDQLQHLQDFVRNNQEPVERYHVVSEILNMLGEEDISALNQIEGEQGKLNHIKEKLTAACNGQNQHLYICGESVNLQTDISLDPVQTDPNLSRGQLINKFVNVMVDLDGFNFLNLQNFASAFVDNKNFSNPTGDITFASDFSAIIERGKEQCRQQALLTDENVQRCLSASIAGLSEQEQNTIRRLESLSGKDNISSLSEVTQAYVEVAKRTSQLHRDEAVGGTIDNIVSLADTVSDWGSDFSRAEQIITNPEQVQDLRNKFKNFTHLQMANLGGLLANGEFDQNNKVFKQYSSGRSGDLDMGKRGTENRADYANRLLKQIACKNRSASCHIQTDIFKLIEGDNLGVNEDNIIAIFSELKEIYGSKEAVEETLFGNNQQGLIHELARLDSEIASIKNQEEYKRLNAFKDFVWGQVKTSCMSNPERDFVQEIAGRECHLNNQVRTGLNDFLKVGDDLLSFTNREDKKASLNQMAEYCRQIFTEDRATYDEELGQTGICPQIFDDNITDQRTQAVQTERNRLTERRKRDRNAIYEYDSRGRIVDVYRPKDNLSIFLPQLAYTVNEQLPFYFVQRPMINIQVEQWRQAGFAQKTQAAYFDSLRQSWMNNTACGAFGCFYNQTVLETASPTFGQTAFDFSSSTTTPFSL